MPPISFRFVVAALAGAAMTVASVSQAAAGGFYTGGNFGSIGTPGGTGPGCGGGGGGGSTINIYKPVTITTDINITKNINLSKNININKSVVINKGGAEAFAFAQALASANASASANVTVYAGNNEYVTVNARPESDLGEIKASGHCEMQEATVVKAVHAVCVSAEGREFPASHMTADTWIESSYEGEVVRCIPGSHVKIVIGDVLQSDQGMAGTYSNGVILQCGEHEAVRHYKDGMLKCAPAMAVPDCTERTNLRKYGTGDMFFTYRSTVCVTAPRTASRELELEGLKLNGGVGDDSGY